MKKLKNCKSFILGVVLSIILFSFVSPAFAAPFTKTAQLSYNNIKITLNGQPVIPKDVNGKAVDPFIIDGTTYLPVRAVGNALGLGVDWDSSTDTVLLTGASSSDGKWNQYKNAYPFLFLHEAADDYSEILDRISNSLSYINFISAYVYGGGLAASEYKNFYDSVSLEISRLNAEISINNTYIEQITGTHDSADFKSYHKELLYASWPIQNAVKSLQDLLQVVNNRWIGNGGARWEFNEVFDIALDYIGNATLSVDNVKKGTLNYMFDSLPQY